MTGVRRIAPQRLFAVTGLAIIALSLGWWWLTYQDVILYGYLGVAEAGSCLVADNAICRLARALCRGAHPLDIVDYRNIALWLGIAAVSASLLLPARRQT